MNYCDCKFKQKKYAKGLYWVHDPLVLASFSLQALRGPDAPCPDILCRCPSKEELVLPRTTTLSKVQQEGRKAGRHSDNVFPRDRASERAECRRRRRAICRNELHFESGWDWEALTYREARCVSGMTNHYYTRILHRWKSFCLSTPS